MIHVIVLHFDLTMYVAHPKYYINNPLKLIKNTASSGGVEALFLNGSHTVRLSISPSQGDDPGFKSRPEHFYFNFKDRAVKQDINLSNLDAKYEKIVSKDLSNPLTNKFGTILQKTVRSTKQEEFWFGFKTYLVNEKNSKASNRDRLS